MSISITEIIHCTTKNNYIEFAQVTAYVDGEDITVLAVACGEVIFMARSPLSYSDISNEEECEEYECSLKISDFRNCSVRTEVAHLPLDAILTFTDKCDEHYMCNKSDAYDPYEAYESEYAQIFTFAVDLVRENGFKFTEYFIEEGDEIAIKLLDEYNEFSKQP